MTLESDCQARSSSARASATTGRIACHASRTTVAAQRYEDTIGRGTIIVWFLSGCFLCH